MKLIAMERELPGSAGERFAQLAEAEARQVWKLIQDGSIREIYFRKDCDEAVIILECASLKDAQEVLETLPFVQEGLIDFELIPLKAYPGLERLFKNL